MRRLKRWDWAATTIMLVGAGFRLYHLFIFSFEKPFRLGGLFYEFSRQIALNNFVLPVTIPYYSANGIPFAYPPLSFYIQAIIFQLFEPQLFFTVNLIPPIITILSMPAFYWMLRQYSDDKRLILASLFAFALIPPTFINQIEAAGLAESFGMVILILYLGFLLRWKKRPNWIDTFLAGPTLGLCILASPGSAYAATLFSIIFFIWVCIQGLIFRSWRPIGMLILLAATGLVISSPYWLSVMHNHGVFFLITPFIGQHQSDVSPLQIEQIISFQPAGNYLSFIWNWLILAGFILALLKRQFLIIVIFISFWLIPREGIWLVSIPASILAGIGLVYVVFPVFTKAFHPIAGSRPPLIPGILGVIAFILVLANAFFSVNVSIADSNWLLSPDQIDALTIFRDEIPINGRVITVGNVALAEWSPTILQREVLNIEYGLEWEPDELKKVQFINAALDDEDFPGLINALEKYTDDLVVYLVSSSDDLAWLQDSVPETNHLELITSTPPLGLYILTLK